MNNKINTSDILFTQEMAMEYLNCGRTFLWERRMSGEIESVNAGRKVLIPKRSIDKFLGLKVEERSNANV